MDQALDAFCADLHGIVVGFFLGIDAMRANLLLLYIFWGHKKKEPLVYVMILPRLHSSQSI